MNRQHLESWLSYELHRAEIQAFSGNAYYSHKPRGQVKENWYVVNAKTISVPSLDIDPPRPSVRVEVRRLSYTDSMLEFDSLRKYTWQMNYQNDYQIPAIPESVHETFNEIIGEEKNQRDNYFLKLFPETRALIAKANLIGEDFSLIRHSQETLRKIVDDIGMLLNDADERGSRSRDNDLPDSASWQNKSTCTLNYNFSSKVGMSYTPRDRSSFISNYSKNFYFRGHLGNFIDNYEELVLVIDQWLTTLKQLTHITDDEKGMLLSHKGIGREYLIT